MFGKEVSLVALNIRLITDQDYQEALERQARIRVFKDDHIIDSGGVIVRFDSRTVVIQTGVGDLAYHDRAACEIFELRTR
ncbi:hypothetical protein B0G52_104262 [Cohnella sp. SGD-V74]|jgi:hypothetical protein|nr:hypothetical protein B0G52_104262 [Cohnella sp. SGD-V74]